jgi:hypothetical protein
MCELVIKSRRMRWVGHVECMGGRRVAYMVWWGNLKERDHLEDGRIMTKLVFNK